MEFRRINAFSRLERYVIGIPIETGSLEILCDFLDGPMLQ